MFQDWPAPENDLHLIRLPTSQLTDDEVLRKARVAVRNVFLGEIRRALDEHLSMASLSLSLCAIDLLGTLRAGKAADYDTFTRFVESYLPSYPSKSMKRLRDDLLHSYQIPHAFAYATDGQAASWHLKPIRPGSEILVLAGQVLAADIDQAAERMFRDAREPTNPIRAHIITRVRRVGVLLIVPIELSQTAGE